MQDHSAAVFIEGDCPVTFVDLSVFVAPPPASGKSLLERVVRDHAAAHKGSIDKFEQALKSPEATARLLATGFCDSWRRGSPTHRFWRASTAR